MNPMYVAIRLKRKLLENMTTYCKNCSQKVSYKETDDKGTFTQKCACGCHIYKQHEPDEHNADAYYTRTFVSKKTYNKEFAKKDFIEQNGFTKRADGSYVK